MGYCPDLPLNKPFCRGNGLKVTPAINSRGYDFLPSSKLAASWVAFQGDVDQVCAATAVDQFVAQTDRAEIVKLPKVGHGFSVQRNWMPQFKASFSRIIATTITQSPIVASEIKDLPLVEVPAANPGKTFAVIVSGDGGWASIDKSLADALAADDIPVVGLDSLHYFWTKQTPDEAAKALQRILDYYFTAWKMDKVILIGYSRGADVLPFMISRLPATLRDRTALVALLGAEHTIKFEFHVADWIPDNADDTAYKVHPEVDKLDGTNLLCIYGEDEAAPLCPDLDAARFKILKLPGGHHFGGDYSRLAELILNSVG